MGQVITRREFIKFGGLALSSFVFTPIFPEEQEQSFRSYELGRVTISQISVYSLPRDDARIIRQLFRDEIVNLYKSVTPVTGPAWNPLWYRVWGGYVHSAHIQKVDINTNPVVSEIRENGQLAEVTVPYSRAYRFTNYNGWERLYALYYTTTHWVTGIETGPDNNPWYKITDELLHIDYFVPRHHLRLIPDDELTPISPEVPFEDKRIDVNLQKQTLTAYEKDEVVLFTKISSGIKTTYSTNGIPTQTPTGRFNISVKMPSKHMGNGRLTDNLEDYELVGVPWTAFFHPDGYAIHGTYWHNNFGIPMSRGCINMPNDKAKWLFRWMTPENFPTDVDRRGYGTILNIF